MTYLDREAQTSIYKNAKKIGWAFTFLSVVIMIVGLMMTIIYVMDFYQSKSYTLFAKLRNVILTIDNAPLHPVDVSKAAGTIYDALAPGKSAINVLTNSYFNNFLTWLKVFAAGVISFFCIRMAVNVLLMFRAWDDKMTIIESQVLFASRTAHLTAIIICQIAIVICVSYIVPQFLLSATAQFGLYLSNMDSWINIVTDKFASVTTSGDQNDYLKLLTESQVKITQIKNYYFGTNGSLNQFKPIAELLLYQDGATIAEYKQLWAPIIKKNIISPTIVFTVFFCIWIILNVSNTTVSTIEINKFNKQNDRYTPKKMMFDNKESRTSYYV